MLIFHKYISSLEVGIVCKLVYVFNSIFIVIFLFTVEQLLIITVLLMSLDTMRPV